MIRKISRKNITPLKHINKKNTKFTDRKIANIFAENSSPENLDKRFKKEKNKKVKLNSQNTEDYNQPFSITELNKTL